MQVKVYRECESFRLGHFVVEVSDQGCVHASRVLGGFFLKARLKLRIKWAKHQLKAMLAVQEPKA
jgi:hypothetical protein